MMIKAKKHAGFTILELLIAALLTSIIATAAFSFFIRTNEQYLSQDDISEMQQNVRASIQNITRELRMAGYCITDTTIIPLAIDSLSGLTDTLTIRRDTFTVKFYVDHSDSLHPALMKEVNGQAQVFADEISGFDVSVVGSRAVRVTLTGTTSRNDDQINNGQRLERTATQVVNLRNL